jgi:hypothetical protein
VIKILLLGRVVRGWKGKLMGRGKCRRKLNGWRNMNLVGEEWRLRCSRTVTFFRHSAAKISEFAPIARRLQTLKKIDQS